MLSGDVIARCFPYLAVGTKFWIIQRKMEVNAVRILRIELRNFNEIRHQGSTKTTIVVRKQYLCGFTKLKMSWSPFQRLKTSLK